MRRILAALVLFLAAAAHGAEPRHAVAVGDSPVLGPSTAPVTLVEFLDYQ